MRKLIPTLYILSMSLLLSGCGGNIFSSHRDMERLRPVQTIGLDSRGEGVMLSISTGVGPDDGPPLVMTAYGGHIEAAVQRLQDYSPEDELFYAHVRYILLGDGMADGDRISALLDWVERSPAMRMETPLLLVKGSAGEAAAAATGERADITERLASLEREERTRGRHIATLRETASALMEHGCALCETAISRPAEGTVITDSEAEADALVPAGWAVLLDDGAPVYLSEGETLGAELLTGGVSGARVAAGDYMLELISGGADVSERRGEDGDLAGIDIRCTLHAGVIEGPSGGEEDVRTALTAEAETWLRAVTARSQDMGRDFLCLEDAARRRAVLFAREEEERWEDIFSDFPIDITVEARIDRSYDLAREAP